MGDNAHPNSNEKSCILWQNEEQTVTLLDIPRSIELAQQFEDLGQRKLWSSHPLQNPYRSVEPKSSKALAALKSPDIDELILQRVLTLAVEDAGKAIWGIISKDGRHAKRYNVNAATTTAINEASFPPLSLYAPRGQFDNCHGDDSGFLASSPCSFFSTASGCTITVFRPGGNSPIILPANSTHIRGSITSTLPIFMQRAPQFPLIILDPPWPNRSARRAGCYQTSYGTAEIGALLSSIPLRSKLERDGLVARFVAWEGWRGGVFEEWGVELVEEWVWLKTTARGEPVSPLDGIWRKPYEILLVGRNTTEVGVQNDVYGTECHKEHDEFPDKKEQEVKAEKQQERGCIGPLHVKRRIIIAVPDLHSRKPNITTLFAPLLHYSQSSPLCLEIFARNLMADSWAWGDEVLKFQSLEALDRLRSY